MSSSRRPWIALIAVLLWGTVVTDGGTTDYGVVSSLKGLKGIGIMTGGFDDRNSGAPGREEAKSAAEAEFRKAGIRIYRLSDPQDSKAWQMQGEPTFILRFLAAGSDGRNAAVLSFELVQKATLARNGTRMNAITWAENFLLLNPDREAVLDALRSNLNYFINDYLSVNPK